MDVTMDSDRVSEPFITKNQQKTSMNANQYL